MNGDQIVEALETLKEAYPNEEVELWCKLKANREEFYTAKVGDINGVMQCDYSRGPTPLEAVDGLIMRASSRSYEAALDKKIAQLRDELAKLEAAQQQEAAP